ncbi:hypothetical protein ABT126_07465 [Streptomyces sp. NPDC002012]|uniref:hypothetical protein n=1 Tax=Streptomyces sp. NPDC002012 TaxID=3154532 RepID=UPI00331CA9A0
MVPVNPKAYAEAVIEGVRNISPPGTHQRRRTGTGSAFESSIKAIQEAAKWLESELRSETSADPTFYAYEFSLEITSHLYAAGASHEEWRSWSSLAAIGSAIRGEKSDACTYAILSGDHSILRSLGTYHNAQDIHGSALWKLAVDRNLELEEDGQLDALDSAWVKLAKSITGGDHIRTEESLQLLAEYWIEEDEDWDVFHPRSYPCFDPYICAGAALARRNGYRPHNLSQDVQKFLDPGLAPQIPDPFML